MLTGDGWKRNREVKDVQWRSSSKLGRSDFVLWELRSARLHSLDIA